MPNSIALATYSIRLKSKIDQEYLPVNSFGASDLLDVFREYLEERETEAAQDEEAERMLRVIRLQPSSRVISGVLESGEYGFESELVNATNQKTVYKRQRTDAELLPFYFLISVPSDADHAVLILQRFRQFGVRVNLWKDFLEFFDPYRGDVTIELNPIVPPGLLEQVRASDDVRSIRFIHHGLPADVADKLAPEADIPEDEGVMELVIKPDPGGRLPVLGAVRDWWRGEGHLPGPIELLGYEFDDVKVQLDVDGRKRTVNFSKPQGIRPEYDVTDEVRLDPGTGHPRFTSIDRLARDILEDVHHYLGIG